MKIFEANKVCKKIDGHMLINEVSISISQGEKVAITGKNGSGKSSLLKLLGGIFTETEGQVKRPQINIGYVPEHFPENIRFKIHDYLMLVGKMSSGLEEEILKRIESYAELFAIQEFLNTPLKNCSKGTKQKVGIIQALLNNPDLLLLDEPLTGLDDNAKFVLLTQLNNLQSDKTVIFTTHEPILIEKLADRILTVENGRIVSDSTTVKNNEKVRNIIVKITNRNIISDIPSISSEWLGGDTVEICVFAKESDKILSMLLERGCSIIELIEKR
ncbi:ATP-binding cassette domain-containing protein [Bacillus alkalicellulosilyticus]|uniref:ATP-binding cassette domain-containing protein n=1 Tax=Alkalihalobacterium alkalicellulosilyticum TaxID=1912214 RepID=UPI000998818B|nr:ATP-binding cassette domain-containing protein [Bacillus alkalicellulosilyticus]